MDGGDYNIPFTFCKKGGDNNMNIHERSSMYYLLFISDDGVIREKELANFYVRFVGISPEAVESLAKYAMEQMTDVSLDGPRCEKTYLQGFRRSEIQTSLLSYRD